MDELGSFDNPLILGFLVALGVGLLIGLERERRKGSGPGRGAAGIRTFTIVALSGAVAAASPAIAINKRRCISHPQGNDAFSLP